MKDAGIKVWVLTGDKIETAVNIGVSAGLLDANMDQYIIEDTQTNAISIRLEDIKKRIQKNCGRRKQAIIIAGHSLVTIDGDEFIRKLFLNASDQVDVVLACRVSPK
jgi:phospholipid-transporting ATPase